jgi:O-antigen/teichoic acid export membrane protein
MLLRLSATYLAGKTIPALLSFALIALYTRLLSPADYGVYAFVTASATLAVSLAAMWLCTAATRLYGRPGDTAPVRWSLGIGFGAVALVGLVGALLSAAFIGKGDRLLLALGYLLFLATAWFELNADMLTAQLKAGRCVAMGVLRTVLCATLGGALAYAGFGAPGILIGTIIGIAVPGALMAPAHWRGFRLRPGHGVALRQLLRFGLPLSLSFAVNALVYATDRYIVSAFGGVAMLGLYAAGFDLADRIVKSITQPLGTAMLPLLAQRFEQEGVAGARQQARQNFLLLAGLAMPVCLGLIAITPELVQLTLGEPYRAMARTIIPIIAVTALLGALRDQYFDHAFHIGLKTGRHVIVVVIMAVVNLIAGIVLVQKMGPVGAAYGTLIAYAIGLAASIGLGRTIFALPIPLGAFLRILAASLGMMSVSLAITVESVALSLLLKIMGGAIVYFGLVLVLDIGELKSVHWPRLRASVSRTAQV